MDPSSIIPFTKTELEFIETFSLKIIAPSNRLRKKLKTELINDF